MPSQSSGFAKYVAFTLPLFYLAVGRTYPWGLAGPFGIQVGTGVWLLLTLLFWIGLLRTFRAGRPLPWRMAPLALLPAMVFGLDLASYFQFKKFGYTLPVLPMLLSVALAIYFFVERKGLRPGNQVNEKRVFVFASIWSLVHLASWISHAPLVVERSDMLPVMKRALELWSAGLPGYGARLNPIYAIGYPPLNKADGAAPD